MQKLASKYVLIYATTRDILTDPFGFGDSITDTPQETKRAAKYLGEGFLFFYSLLKIFDPIDPAKTAGIPFVDELLALVLVAGRALHRPRHASLHQEVHRQPSLHPTARCRVFYTGAGSPCSSSRRFSLPSSWEWAGCQRALEQARTCNSSPSCCSACRSLFVYYMGSICTWIAKVHATEPIIAGLALLAGYLISTGVVSVIGYSVKSLWVVVQGT